MRRSFLKPLCLSLVVVLAGCTAAPKYRTTKTVHAEPSIRGKEVVEVAKSYLGTPYRAGGTSKSGVDCSGLVVTVYRKFGLALPRTSKRQARFGDRIEPSQLKPGDLVFFRASGGSTVSHVGIYSGRGEFIHASTRARRVRIDRLDERYFRKRFVVARRVL